MVQVKVKRDKYQGYGMFSNQEVIVNCSEVKGYVIGNGPSREHLILEELKETGIIYGCNALYRDWEPDFLFANDFRMVSEIHKDNYKGNCVFSDLDVLPVHYFEDVLQGIRLSLPSKQAVKVDYTGNRDTATSFVYMGYAGNSHEVLWVNEEETPQYEWNFKPLTELPSTGTMALQRAAENGHKEIIMYGFDGLKSGNYRNVYDGTYLYKTDAHSHDGLRHPETYRPKDADNWEKYVNDIIEKYPESKIEII